VPVSGLFQGGEQMSKTGHVGVSGNRALQNLMTGLIYPAVLGTILFSVLQLAEANLRALFGPEKYVFSLAMALKYLLLLITLAFYGCDYLYAMYTRDYVPLFFAFDVVFVVCLYATVQVIDIGGGELMREGWLVALFYLIFMLLYRWWDGRERCCCVKYSEKCLPGEMEFYDRVIKWENWSIMGLISCFLLLFFWRNYLTLLAFVVVLSGVTLFFRKYAWEKKSFYLDPGATLSTGEEVPEPGP